MLGQDVKWLQTITHMPILVKGVMTAEDSKHLDVLFLLNFVSLVDEFLYEILLHLTSILCSNPLQQGLQYKLEQPVSLCPITELASLIMFLQLSVV